MKTKEIEVWVDEKILATDMDNYVNYNVNTGKHKIIGSVKARLIIDLPEKKVEITESQFDEILKDARSQYRDTSDCIWHLRKTLFGKEEK